MSNETTFKVKQPDGSSKRYYSETEIYPDQAYQNYLEDSFDLEDNQKMTYIQFCEDRFIEVK